MPLGDTVPQWDTLPVRDTVPLLDTGTMPLWDYRDGAGLRCLCGIPYRAAVGYYAGAGYRAAVGHYAAAGLP